MIDVTDAYTIRTSSAPGQQLFSAVDARVLRCLSEGSVTAEETRSSGEWETGIWMYTGLGNNLEGVKKRRGDYVIGIVVTLSLGI